MDDFEIFTKPYVLEAKHQTWQEGQDLIYMLSVVPKDGIGPGEVLTVTREMWDSMESGETLFRSWHRSDAT